MLEYPARIKRTAGGFYIVSFRDIPEALTQGKTFDEAVEMAADALLTAMDFYFDDRREVPAPSKAKSSEVPIALPASAAAKVLLLNEMVRQNVKPAELARRLETSQQSVNRIVNLGYTTKIDNIAEALGALGKRLELRLA